MVSLKWFNEKGNVSVKVRDGVRAQVKEALAVALNDTFEQVEVNANGGLSFPIAVDGQSNKTIYAHIDLTVNTKSPDEKVERKKSTKKATQVNEPVPNLFD